MDQSIDETILDGPAPLELWREYWPWKQKCRLPELAPDSGTVQVFARLDMGNRPGMHVIRLNGVTAPVPIAQDRLTQRWEALLPVPTPHITIRYSDQIDSTTGQAYTEIAVTTEGGA